MRKQKKIVFITDVTSGLGLALAIQFLKIQWHVIGIGEQSIESIDRRLQNRIDYFKINLADENAIEKIPVLL